MERSAAQFLPARHVLFEGRCQPVKEQAPVLHYLRRSAVVIAGRTAVHE